MKRLTKLEKAVFMLLTAFLAIGVLVFISMLGKTYVENKLITQEVFKTAALQDTAVLVKDKPYQDEFNDLKLNLNRTNEKSIAALPGVSKSTAKKIFSFIESRGRITSLNELLEIKGFNRKKLENLEKYATVEGGHSGFAAWGDKLNINFASEDDFSALPKIGKKLARQIVDFRNKNGGFRSVDELLEIQGITDEKFNGIKDKIRVN